MLLVTGGEGEEALGFVQFFLQVLRQFLGIFRALGADGERELEILFDGDAKGEAIHLVDHLLGLFVLLRNLGYRALAEQAAGHYEPHALAIGFLDQVLQLLLDGALLLAGRLCEAVQDIILLA